MLSHRGKFSRSLDPPAPEHRPRDPSTQRFKIHNEPILCEWSCDVRSASGEPLNRSIEAGMREGLTIMSVKSSRTKI